MALLKAVPLGMSGAMGLAFIMHRAGHASGGVMALQHVEAGGHNFFWSWPIFCAGTLLAWTVFKLTE